MSGCYGGMGYSSQDEFARDLEEIQRRSYERQKAIESGLGIKDPEAEEAERKHRADSIAKVRQEERERNRPSLVIKSDDTNADRFNTVTAPDEFAENKLIRAMIDQTTKAHEGTRLRFKLLDDVTVSGTRLKKGTYLYGTVTGFGQQRVRASITSILVGDRFIKVKLSVFDNDGMEGFYVPESAFRDFMKDAGVDISYGGATTAAAEAQGLDEAGKTVSFDELQPGDLIFYSFTSNGRYKNISHVAVYVGNGKVVEALNESLGVVYRDVASTGKIVVIGRP